MYSSHMATKKSPSHQAQPAMDAVRTRMLNTPSAPFTPPAKPVKKARARRPPPARPVPTARDVKHVWQAGDLIRSRRLGGRGA